MASSSSSGRVVYGFGPESPAVEVINKSLDPLSGDSFDAYRLGEVNRFDLFWDLLDTLYVHGYLQAALSVIGRSAVGAWWSLRKNDDFETEATTRQRKRLNEFYSMPNRKWNNIKDFYSLAYKFASGAMYLRLFGQCAFEILRNSQGRPIGFDFLHGLVMPNVDEKGNFKSPAFWQYPTRNVKDKVAFNDPKDIVYIVNPDWEGYPTGGSDIRSLTDLNLPTDLYLQIAAREYLKNRDVPEAYYVLSSDISDDAFDDFVKALKTRYAGPKNAGKSPIAVQGELDIKTVSKMPTDLPYHEARAETRQEALAAAGVHGTKLGLTEYMTNANLKENRREFHETTMIPIFKYIELGFYEQVHMREFEAPGWEMKFNNPDFLNAVERATVHMRYYQMNSMTPNQIRRETGKPQRTDPGGDLYADQLKEAQSAVGEPQGSPPEGRPVEPDDPAQVGEPNDAAEDPVRGDQHDEESRSIIDELRQWRSFAVRRIKNGKLLRSFDSEVIPEYLRDAIQDQLVRARSVEELKAIFSEVEGLLEEYGEQ